MANARPIRWLHLSDLHLGCRGQELWWQVETELARDVRAMVERRGAGPDLILFSGDLTFKGDKQEFELVERFLDALRGWLREAGSTTEPLLLAVPGNHDVVRPTGADAIPFRPFDHWATQGLDNEDVRLLHAEFWEAKKSKRVASLFAPYQAWFTKKVWPEIERRAARKHRSHFPGDFSAEIDVPGAFPLLIVGLNSAWLQYSGADFERKLALPLAQFQAALPHDPKRAESPLPVFDSKPRALLMIHHPPSWLSKKAREAFDEGIYPTGNGRLGHCDLAGNVWEWCSIEYVAGDPTIRVVRGGAFWFSAVLLRSAYRGWDFAGSRRAGVGFRCAGAAPAAF